MTASCCAGSVHTGSTAVDEPYRPTAGEHPGRRQVAIAGAEFAMGDSFEEGYVADGETPTHPVELDGFRIDATAVTNAEFAAFVTATGYRTDAEELGISAVFRLAAATDADVLHALAAAPWWLAVRGASWRHPDGGSEGVERRSDHPVVHVSWHDAQAYCRWAGARLPTEAEWEFAARGGLAGARYPWGDELTPGGRWRANISQGTSPVRNSGEDGYLTTAPVTAYPPNGHGLHNMVGNVWEWCADWFAPNTYARSAREDPRGPASGTERVLRGGSYLCHASYCHRYRVAARSHNAPDSTSANVGFRCASS